MDLEKVPKLPISELKKKKQQLQQAQEVVDKEIEKKQNKDRQKRIVRTEELGELIEKWKARITQFETSLKDIEYDRDSEGRIVLPEKIKVLQKVIGELNEITHKKEIK